MDGDENGHRELRNHENNSGCCYKSNSKPLEDFKQRSDMICFIFQKGCSVETGLEKDKITKVTSESIAIVNERRDRGLTLGDGSENEEKWTLEIYWRQN